MLTWKENLSQLPFHLQEEIQLLSNKSRKRLTLKQLLIMDIQNSSKLVSWLWKIQNFSKCSELIRQNMSTPVVNPKWSGAYNCSICRRKRLIADEFSKGQIRKLQSRKITAAQMKCKRCTKKQNDDIERNARKKVAGNCFWVFK